MNGLFGYFGQRGTAHMSDDTPRQQAEEKPLRLEVMPAEALQASVPQEKTPPAEIVLIDLENCPNQVGQLMENLARFSHVLLCYAKTTTKVPLDWIVPLTTVVNENKLKIVKMSSSGKNAADFGICFWAGVYMQQMPANTHFIIVSEDNDLDYAVNLLRSEGRTAERISTKQKADVNMALALSAQDILQNFCQKLMASNNRPHKNKAAVVNNLKNYCQQDSNKAEQIFEQLHQNNALVVDNKTGKVSYNDAQLRLLASASEDEHSPV
jgi:hypothetical protein